MRTGTIVSIGLLLVIVSVAGIGLLVGSGSGDQSPSADAEVTETDQLTATPEPTPTTTPPETVTPPQTVTPTPTEPSTPPEDDGTEPVVVDQPQLVTEIEAELNEDRSFTSEYSTDGQTATELAYMAENHSQDMADEQFLSHNVGEGNSGDRYEQRGLFDRCQFQVDNYIEDASDNELEAIGRVSVDNYADGGPGTLEERLAEALVSDWESSPTYSERISYENAETMGVGVAVSDDDDVYATVNFC